MEAFYFILLVPVLWALVAKLYFKQTLHWGEVAIQITASCLIVAIVYFIGQYGQTRDVEIWNGEITDKSRQHDSYVRTYQCNCYTTCSGTGSSRSCTTHCQTCYENHYTVTWALSSNIGTIRLKHLDRTSRSVYNTPDPNSYKEANIGDPCSIEKAYTNYIKAVPESLFNNSKHQSAMNQFKDMIPSYPRVHSHYKVNRVIPVGISVPDLPKWNESLSEQLKVVGPKKQANIIIVLVNTPNQSYRYALEKAWNGGKKNDVIVVMGVPNFPEISWADTITLGQNSGNSLMTVLMRDRLTELNTAEDHNKVISTVTNTVLEKFDRKPMADYEYLADEVDPPFWVVMLAIILSLIASGVLTYVFHRNDTFGEQAFRRYR